MSKKSKIAVIILSVVVVLLGVYSFVTTMVLRESLYDYEELSDKYEEVSATYKELSDKYVGEYLDEVSAAPIVIESVARQIDDNATVQVVNESAYMYLPYSSNIKDKVETFAWAIPTSLETYKYKSCVIIVVDDNGKCVYGWTILPNGKSYAFLSE